MESFLLESHFTYIFHISDVHILNGEERQQEFILQFKRTFNTIASHPKFNKSSSLIAVTGDLLDKGIKMSAIAIELLQLLVDGLTSLAPTIIIPGNHDDKKDVGQSTLDSLTAVFNEGMQSRPNLYYLKETGIYLFGDNLAFGHTSVIDKKLIRAEDIKTTNRLKIGLFHGMIDSSSSSDDDTFILQNCDFVTKDFDGYDKVLLGDVHKAHAVGKDHRLWYAGSLVQKSFAEDRRQHGGLLVWDLYSNADTPPQYIHIPNDHEYLVLNVEKGQITGELTETTGSLHLRTLKPFQVNSLPKISSIRFKCDHATQHSHLDLLTQQLETKTRIIKNNRIWTEQSVAQTTKSTENTNSTTPKSDPFNDYLTQYYPNHITELQQLHTKYYEENKDNQEEANCYGKWNLEQLSMENIYNYRNHHQIPFSTLPKDIISITGKNGTGKSKIIDSILLAIYGCGPKLVPHVISHDKKKGNTTITISINGDTYQIHRTYTKGKCIKGNKTTLAISKNGVDETATDKPQNEKAIIRLFGERDDLCDTHISLQGHHQAFIHKKEKEQRELLKRIFNTNVYETLEKTVKGEITTGKKDLKQTQHKLERYPEVDLVALQKTLEQLQQQTPELIRLRDQQIQALRDNDIARERDNTLTKSLTRFNRDHDKLEKTKRPSKYNKGEIQNHLQNAEVTIQNLKTDTTNIQLNIDKCREQKHPITTTLLQDIKQLETRIVETSKSHSQYKTQLQGITSKREVTSNSLSDTIETLERHTQEKYDIISTMDQQRKWTYPTQEQYKTKLKQTDLVTLAKDHEIQIQALENNITQFLVKNKNNDLNQLEGQYREYQEILLKQKLVTTTSSSLEGQIKDLTLLLDNHKFTYHDTCPSCTRNQTINLIPEKIAEREKYRQQLIEQTTTSQAYQVYLDRHRHIPTLYREFTEYRAQLTTKTKLDTLTSQHREASKLQEEFTEFQQHLEKQQTLSKLEGQITELQGLEAQQKVQVLQLQGQETELTEKIQTYQLQLQQEQTKMQSFIKEQTYIQENARLDGEISQLTDTLNSQNKKIDGHNQEITDLTKMKSDLDKNIEIDGQLEGIMSQQLEIQTELSKLVVHPPETLETQLKLLERQLGDHQKLIQETSKKQQQQQEEQVTRRELLDNIDILQYDLDLYTKYLKITQDYPLYLNKKGFKTLETLINQHLWNMTKFKIEILDDISSLTFLKVDRNEKIPIDYCSGFEKFAISIAIRIALAKIHPFNSMNSLIIDEGFGVFDSDNLKRLPEMLEPLTLIFNQIFIITHIDELQSELKQKIHITKDINGIPKIQY